MQHLQKHCEVLSKNSEAVICI